MSNVTVPSALFALDWRVFPFASCNSNVNSSAFNRRRVPDGLASVLRAFGVTVTGWLEYELTNRPSVSDGLVTFAFNWPLLSSVTVTVHAA